MKFIYLLFSLFLASSAFAQTSAQTRLFDQLIKKNMVFSGHIDMDAFHNGCSMACGSLIWNFSSSSELAPQGKNQYGAKNLADDKSGTAWVEGKSGDGIGEYLLVTFKKQDPKIKSAKMHWGGFRLINGYAKSEAIWRANSRIKDLEIYLNGKFIARTRLKDTPVPQEVIFSQEINEGDQAKLVIKSVYRGNKYQDTAMSSLIMNGGH